MKAAMRVIATDRNLCDLAPLSTSCELDLEFGPAAANDFELRVPMDALPRGLAPGGYVYADGTEYGGTVDYVGADTTGRIHKAVYGGRSWHGIMNGKVIRPDAGNTHLAVTGEANAALLQLIGHLGLLDVFSVSNADSGFRLVGYRFARYAKGYEGACAMLASVGAKLSIRWTGRKVELAAVPAIDYASREFEGRTSPMWVKRSARRINHLVCLGKGELQDRVVADLFADEGGRVSDKQTLFGIDEIADVYDYSSAEIDELLEAGAKRLAELQEVDQCDVAGAGSEFCGIGDFIGGRESRVGSAELLVSGPVDKITVSATARGATVSCETTAPAARVTGAV